MKERKTAMGNNEKVVRAGEGGEGKRWQAYGMDGRIVRELP